MKKLAVILVVIIYSPFLVISQTQILGIINHYASVTSIDSKRLILSVDDPSGFKIGDRALIIQMKGAQIDTTNTINFGNILDYRNCGNYEFVSIKGIENLQIALDNSLCRDYDTEDLVQLVSIPVYDSAIVNGVLTAKSWNGKVGGILALKVNGTLYFGENLNVDGLGFKGGNRFTSTWQCSQLGYFYPLNGWQGARKGEGIVLIGNDKLNGRGHLANGGGGGNCTNAGGAGGGNYGAGGGGGRQFYDGCDSIDIGGIRGINLNYSNNINKVFLAGGGGAGHENDDAGSSGGNGGGLIIIEAKKIEGYQHVISSKGINSNPSGNDAAGGGGAGGTILLFVDDFGETGLNIIASGGNGGNCNVGGYVHCYGTGGGGGGGIIWIEPETFTNNVSVDLLGGKNGIINYSGSPCNRSNYGASSGETGGILNQLQLASCCDETSFIFPDFKKVDKITFIGSSIQENNNITLTPDLNWKNGAIWYNEKIPVKLGFITEFSFRFSNGVDKYIPEDYPGADGIVFVIQNDKPNSIGGKGGSLGFNGLANSFVVEYDTYKNISEEADNFHDPNENHVAVFCNGNKINTADHESSANLATNATIFPLVPDGRIFYSKIEYEQNNYLRVFLDINNQYTSPPIIELNNLDLSKLINLSCDEFGWVGFTSATGNAFEKHELLNWSLCAKPTSATIPNPRITQGPDTVCQYQSASYTCNKDFNTDYEWIVEGGVIQYGGNTDKVTIKWGNTSNGKIKLIHKTNSTSCSDTIYKDIFIITKPNFKISGAENICIGKLTKYFAPKDIDFNYNWIISGGVIIGKNDEDSISILWEKEGKGSIKLLFNHKTCQINDSTSISVTIHPLPTITFKELKDLCLNDKPLLLDVAEPKGGKYYGNGVISNSFFPNEAGIGTHDITYVFRDSILDCQNSAIQKIKVLPIPDKPTISQIGHTLKSSESIGNQWLKNSEILHLDTNQYYKPDTSGYFTVIVTGENGCKSEISEPYFFDITPVEEDFDGKEFICIHPNPTNNLINIDFFVEKSNLINIEIFDLIGFSIFRLDNYKTTIGLNNIKIKTDTFSSGVYNLIYNYKNKMIHSKIMIIK